MLRTGPGKQEFELSQKRPDTAAEIGLNVAGQTPTQPRISSPRWCAPARGSSVREITIRRQKPLVLRIMVEQGRTRILFLSELTPRCEQIFPHRCCFQPVRRIRQQMSRARARTIMERKCRAALAGGR